MPDISIITNCHTEGRLLEPTIKSVTDTINEANKVGISTEWILVRDNPDKDTLVYSNKNFHDRGTILDVNYKDLGLSRNAGANIAKGKYLAYIDADDLWSSNWLTAAYTLIESSIDQELILHPGIAIFFEAENNIWSMLDQTDPTFNPHILFKYNCWTVSTFAKKQTYLNYPYKSINLSSGLGFEDWYWNCQTTTNGIIHRLVPNTFHCFRLKSWKSSLLSNTIKTRCIMAENDLFALNYQRVK